MCSSYLQQATDSPHTQGIVKEVTSDDSFSALERSSHRRPLFVLVVASWCGHCPSAKVKFAKLAEASQGDATFVQFDNNECSDTSERLGVNGFPTFFAKDDENELVSVGWKELRQLVRVSAATTKSSAATRRIKKREFDQFLMCSDALRESVTHNADDVWSYRDGRDLYSQQIGRAHV